MAQKSEQGYGFINIYTVFLMFVVNNLSNLLGNIGVTQLGVAGQTQSLPETFPKPGENGSRGSAVFNSSQKEMMVWKVKYVHIPKKLENTNP